MNREQFFQEIKHNIQEHNFHVTYVIKKLSPSFSYTIGLFEKFKYELILAGGVFYMKHERDEIITQIASKIIERNGVLLGSFDLGSLGSFSLSHVDVSWSEKLMLGVYDFYNLESVTAYQIIPDQDHRTLDIPNMSIPLNIELEPVWQWLEKKWEYDIPEDSTVATDLYVLMGYHLTTMVRWEADFWEMWHLDSDNVPKEYIRIVPLSTMLAIDSSIKISFNIAIGDGFWRDEKDDDWTVWEKVKI